MSYKVEKEILKACDVEISYRPKIKMIDRPQLKSSVDIYMFLMENEIFNPDTIEYKEYFKVILFNRSNRVLGILHLSEGGIDHTVVDIQQVMQGIILANSVIVAIAHNHPSSNCKPSREDDSITMMIKNACKLFNILLIEHLIISPYSFYSYADEGKLTL